MGWEGQTRFVSVAVTRCTRERTDRLREEEEGRNNDRERDIGEGRIEEMIVAKLKDRRGRKKEANRREWILHRDGTTINRCCVSGIAEERTMIEMLPIPAWNRLRNMNLALLK